MVSWPEAALFGPRNVLARARLDPATTYFWVCDYVIRQGGIDDCAPGSRFENLTLSVCTIGRTLLLADPWHDPRPLRRSWCLWEILSSGALELILSSSQEEHFRRALVRDFDGIETIRTSVSTPISATATRVTLKTSGQSSRPSGSASA